MKVNNLKVYLLPNTPFLKEDGTFDIEKAMTMSGKIAGICYNENGLFASLAEDDATAMKRANRNAASGHQSVFEHIMPSLYIQNAPKMFQMVLNNEGQYSTSERSLRYTMPKEDTELTEEEIRLYQKWNQHFLNILENKYQGQLSARKMRTIAQENARYMLSVFVPTEMVHTLPLVQLNRLIVMMRNYEQGMTRTTFDKALITAFHAFEEECQRLHLLDDRLLTDFKGRNFRLFGHNLEKALFRDEFGRSYSTTYTASFAELAQAQRHRTISYQMELPKTDEYGYFLPPLLKNILHNEMRDYSNRDLSLEWFEDLKEVRRSYPMGMKVLINERGTMEAFIEKMKERECTEAQYEIWRQTEDTRNEYMEALDRSHHYANEDFRPYTKTMRCGFHDFTCTNPCNRANQKREY